MRTSLERGAVRLVPRVLLIVAAVHGEIGATREREAARLADAAAAAVEALPSGHAARDELRSLRGKILALLEVSSAAQPTEWDASLSALLEADYYGIDDLAALLDAHAPKEQSAESCDDSWTAHDVSWRVQQQKQQQKANPGRRLEQQRPPPPPPPRQPPPSPPPSPLPPLPPRGPPAGAQPSTQPAASDRRVHGQSSVTALLLDGTFGNGLAGLTRDMLAAAAAWRTWALDRPPPWERDCDCCFGTCPQGHSARAAAAMPERTKRLTRVCVRTRVLTRRFRVPRLCVRRGRLLVADGWAVPRLPWGERG
jgi:hypothetical protein